MVPAHWGSKSTYSDNWSARVVEVSLTSLWQGSSLDNVFAETDHDFQRGLSISERKGTQWNTFMD